MGRLAKTIPDAARLLLDFIGSIEAPKGYGTIYGNNQNKLKKPLTTMTLGEIVDAGPSWTKRFGSSAAGRYQFMRATLQGLAAQFPSDIDGSTVLDEDMQDRLAYALLLRRGFADFSAGRTAMTVFGKALAQEWASFPVLAHCKGSERTVRRGQSYYAGDGLNKALVPPDKVESVLRQVLDIAAAERSNIPVPQSRPKTPEPQPASPPADHVKPPVNVDPEKLDKPIGKSKTVWMWIATALGSIGTALKELGFVDLDPKVQLAIVAVIVGFAIYAIKRRRDLANIMRGVKAEMTE